MYGERKVSLEDYLISISHLPYRPINYIDYNKWCTFRCKTCGNVFSAKPSRLERDSCGVCRQRSGDTSDFLSGYVTAMRKSEGK